MRSGHIDYPCQELNQCECGQKPDHYSLGYGPTPYSVQCPGCQKRTNAYFSIGGIPENIINLWNILAPLKELPELTYQIEDGKKIKQFKADKKFKMRNYLIDNYRAKVYYLFENGKIEEPDINKFLWKGIDY